MAPPKVTAKPSSTSATPGTLKAATQTATQKNAQMLKTALFSEIVHIKVGKDLKDFGVHKDLICIMKLPETDTEVFELFVHWLYTQVLWNKDDDGEDEKRPALETMMDLYLFADMIRAVSLMNQSITTIRDFSDADCIVPTQTFARVWKNTTENSPIRHLIVDWMVWEMSGDLLESDSNHFPPGLLLTAMMACRNAVCAFQDEGRSIITMPLLNESNYHVSEDAMEDA
ncbi:hypothetical protein IFR05_012818 [Cadophora sp. M221]|nr:hypothetical protein IFR05_012818 [Cadophora sp. M221]